MKINTKQLAGESGATDAEGSAVTEIACFTMAELREYTRKVVALCAKYADDVVIEVE